jgi:hypothetical protein
MNSLLTLNLISFLDFYFAFMFIAGTWRRWGQYRNVAQLVLAGPGRWPHLMQLMRRYHTLFWTWSSVLPALMALGIWLVQIVVSRGFLPQASTVAGLTIGSLLAHWPALILVIPLGIAMFGFDFYSLYVVGKIDRAAVEKQLDQAEYWLRSRTAHVVRVVTFGRINPRRMVAEEVEKALIAVSDMMNFNLWWVSLQMGLRFAFALALWLTWAVTH